MLAALANAALAQERVEQTLTQNMVPAGRQGLQFEVRSGFAEKGFDAHGNRGALFGDLNGVALNSRMVPSLAALGSTASLGTTQFRSKLTGERFRLLWGAGLTENLTIGVVLPWGEVRNNVSFETAGSNLAANPLFNANAPISATNPPFVPLGAFGTTRAATTDDVQRVLTARAFGYEYRPIGSSRTGGLLDPVFGARWRVATSDTSSTVISPTFRLGLAKKDDPDDLLDFTPEDGSSDIGIAVDHYRRLGAKWDIQLGAQYTYALSDHLIARARARGESLVPKSRTERLTRHPGDSIETGIELGYRLGTNWRLFGRLDYSREFATRYHSDRGQDVSGLPGTDGSRQSNGWIGGRWSGVEAWRAGTIPLPLVVSLQYRTKIYAHNALATHDLYLAFTTVF